MFRRVFKNKIFPDLSDETLTEVPSPYDLCVGGSVAHSSIKLCK